MKNTGPLFRAIRTMSIITLMCGLLFINPKLYGHGGTETIGATSAFASLYELIKLEQVMDEVVVDERLAEAQMAEAQMADGQAMDEQMTDGRADKEWAIALHGGAGYVSPDMPEERRKAYESALEAALEVGSEVLRGGGSALDAVETTVRYLENHELFNAGKGAVFTAEGRNELDAAIMDGHTMNAGAVTGVTTVKNPVSLARKVMTDSRHVFFSGDGAEAFADQVGVERVDPSYFYTERRFESLKRAQEAEKEGSFWMPEAGAEGFRSWRYGTVGAVAKDKEGRLAAATSTGGMTNKRFGRVGDVPIIGSGTYANKDVAVSATGWGEKIMLHVSAHTLAAYYALKGASLQESMDYLVDEVLQPGDAGFVAVDRRGDVSMKTNTGSMFRAAADSEGLMEIAIW